MRTLTMPDAEMARLERIILELLSTSSWIGSKARDTFSEAEFRTLWRVLKETTP